MAERVKYLAKRLVGADKDPDVAVVSTADYFKEHRFNPVQAAFDYVKSLFPIIGWIGKYNFGWLSGDLIAGTFPSVFRSVRGRDVAILTNPTLTP